MMLAGYSERPLRTMVRERLSETSDRAAQEILRRTDRAFRWFTFIALIVCALVLLAMWLRL